MYISWISVSLLDARNLFSPGKEIADNFLCLVSRWMGTTVWALWLRVTMFILRTMGIRYSLLNPGCRFRGKNLWDILQELKKSFWREATQFCFSNSSTRLYHSTCFGPDLGSHAVLRFLQLPSQVTTGCVVLKQDKYIPSQFWRPELQNQGVSLEPTPSKVSTEKSSLLLPASLVPGVPSLGTASL